MNTQKQIRLLRLSLLDMAKLSQRAVDYALGQIGGKINGHQLPDVAGARVERNQLFPLLRLQAGLLKELLHQHARAGSDLAGDEGFAGEIGGSEFSLRQAVAGSSDDDMWMFAKQPHFDFDVGRWLSHNGDVQIIAAQGVTYILPIADL